VAQSGRRSCSLMSGSTAGAPSPTGASVRTSSLRYWRIKRHARGRWWILTCAEMKSGRGFLLCLQRGRDSVKRTRYSSPGMQVSDRSQAIVHAHGAGLGISEDSMRRRPRPRLSSIA